MVNEHEWQESLISGNISQCGCDVMQPSLLLEPVFMSEMSFSVIPFLLKRSCCGVLF